MGEETRAFGSGKKVKISTSGKSSQKWGTRVIGDYGNSRVTYFAGV